MAPTMTSELTTAATFFCAGDMAQPARQARETTSNVLFIGANASPMNDWKQVLRLLAVVPVAFAYKLATFPLRLAGYVLVPFAIWFGVTRPSKLTGETIFTAPDCLAIFGNEQEGYDPQWAIDNLYQGWPTFWRRYSWAAWRNAVRNLPFVLPLFHKPAPDKFATFDVWTWEGFRVELWYRGWLTELKCSKGNWFCDIGPRLDQPEAWGAVSWAFRLAGRL
jgi:hypothetical protein